MRSSRCPSPSRPLTPAFLRPSWTYLSPRCPLLAGGSRLPLRTLVQTNRGEASDQDRARGASWMRPTYFPSSLHQVASLSCLGDVWDLLVVSLPGANPVSTSQISPLRGNWRPSSPAPSLAGIYSLASPSTCCLRTCKEPPPLCILPLPGTPQAPVLDCSSHHPWQPLYDDNCPCYTGAEAGHHTAPKGPDPPSLAAGVGKGPRLPQRGLFGTPRPRKLLPPTPTAAALPLASGPRPLTRPPFGPWGPSTPRTPCQGKERPESVVSGGARGSPEGGGPRGVPPPQHLPVALGCPGAPWGQATLSVPAKERQDGWEGPKEEPWGG